MTDLDITDRISEAMLAVESLGREPALIRLGHKEAVELEDALYRPRVVHLGLLGEVISVEEERAPKLPFPLPGLALLYGVPVERVDEASHLSVLPEEE